MDVNIRVDRRFPMARPELFALAISNDVLVKTFVGAGPIPAIRKAELLTPGPLATGSRRRVSNSDGSVIDEEITALETPSRHIYRLPGGFAFPFNLMVREAEGDWKFSDAAGGTEIVWNYRFSLTTPLFFPVVAPIVRIFFKKAMERCLAGIAAIASPSATRA